VPEHASTPITDDLMQQKPSDFSRRSRPVRAVCSFASAVPGALALSLGLLGGACAAESVAGGNAASFAEDDSERRPDHERGGAADEAARVDGTTTPAGNDSATAQPGGGSRWRFGVFGTLGASHATAAHPAPQTGAGSRFRRRHEWDTGSDSRLGAQLDLQLDRQWSAVLQMVSEQGPDLSYRPTVEWANVKYQLTPEFSIRVGRIALPVFLSTDFRKASYAYPWVRVPPEVYANVPVSSSDGVDLTYRWQGGSVKQVTQAFYGASASDITRSSGMRASRIAGLSHTVDYGALTVRGSYMSSRLCFHFAEKNRNSGPAGVGQLPPDAVDLHGSHAEAMGIGANYDPGTWFVLGELGRIRDSSVLGNKTVLYASTGYRFGDFTPFVAYTQSRGSDLAYTAASADRDGILGSRSIVQATASAGLRWDFAANVALKAQFERVRPRGASNTAEDVPARRFARRGISVASVALSFVY
jgi:hypothetical protein